MQAEDMFDSIAPKRRRIYGKIEELLPSLAPCIPDSTPDLSDLKEETWSWFRNNRLSSHEVQHIDSRTVLFHPRYSYGTAAAIGNKKLTKDVVAYWEIFVEFVFGTSMMFGIGKKWSKMTSPIFFENLIGGDFNSYGLSHKGFLHNGGVIASYCKPFKERHSVVVGIFFNGPKRQMSYFVDGVYQGIAFDNLNLENSSYYPMISSTSQKSCFVVCQQKCRNVVAPLSELCLRQIVMHFRRVRCPNMDTLALPERLRNMVKERTEQLQRLDRMILLKQMRIDNSGLFRRKMTLGLEHTPNAFASFSDPEQDNLIAIS